MPVDWKPIIVEFPNRCVICRIVIKEGESALYMAGCGLKHNECPTGLEPEHDSTSLVIIDEEDKKMLGF